jgi:predicted  nucleic acid-binding Zn ribbon protein
MSYENYVCPKCNNKMIWGGDHDDDVYDFYSTFSCSECKVTSVVYWNGDEEDE